MTRTEAATTLHSSSMKPVTLFVVFALAVFGLAATSPAVSFCLTIVFLSCLLGFALNPLVILLEKQGLDRLKSAAIVILGFLVVAATLVWLLLPVFLQDVNDLISVCERASASPESKHPQERAVAPVLVESTTLVGRAFAKAVEFLQVSLGHVSQFLTSWVAMLMIPLFAFFFLKDGQRIRKRVLSYIPNRYFEMSLAVMHQTARRFSRFLNYHLISFFVVAILSSAALYLLNVRYWLLLGTVAGIAQATPYLRLVLGSTPALLVVWTSSGFASALVVIVAFATVELIRSFILSVLPIRHSVELSLFATLLSLLAGGALLGIPGMLIAAPIASLLTIAFRELNSEMEAFKI